MSNEPDRDRDDASPVYAWWVPEQAVKNISFEREMHPDESYSGLARRLLEENLPAAVMSIIHLAMNSPEEAIRLRAASYMTDQMLGSAKSSPGETTGSREPWEHVYDAVLADAVTDIQTKGK